MWSRHWRQLYHELQPNVMRATKETTHESIDLSTPHTHQPPPFYWLIPTVTNVSLIWSHLYQWSMYYNDTKCGASHIRTLSQPHKVYARRGWCLQLGPSLPKSSMGKTTTRNTKNRDVKAVDKSSVSNEEHRRWSNHSKLRQLEKMRVVEGRLESN